MWRISEEQTGVQNGHQHNAQVGRTNSAGNLNGAVPNSGSDMADSFLYKSTAPKNPNEDCPQSTIFSRTEDRSFTTPPAGLNFQFISDMAKVQTPMDLDDPSSADHTRGEEIRAIINKYEAGIHSDDHSREHHQLPNRGVDDDGEETVEEDRILGLFFASGNLGVAYYDEPNVCLVTNGNNLFYLRQNTTGRAFDGTNYRIKRFFIGDVIH